MDITIQEVNTYYNMVKNGEAPNLYFPGIDNREGGNLIIPKIDLNDHVYLFDVVSQTKITLGIDVIEKIRFYIEKKRNS